MVRAGGAEFVDGGIIGTPPVAPGFIRCYLSGARAEEVRDLFRGTDVDARVITGAGEVAASAMKMAYASWTKGSAALVLAARALARADGVEDALLAEWALSQPAGSSRPSAPPRVGGGQGLAMGGPDGGDRGDHGRGRAAGWLPPGRGRDLPQITTRHGRHDGGGTGTSSARSPPSPAPCSCTASRASSDRRRGDEHPLTDTLR